MLPPGTKVKAGQVCKLTKSLYGLKQSSKQWFSKLSSFLKSISFLQSVFDHLLFIKRTENNFTTLLVYVDDIIFVGNSISEITELTQLMDKTFKLKDLGDLKIFIGLEIARIKDGIHVSQRKYALDIISDVVSSCSQTMFHTND